MSGDTFPGKTYLKTIIREIRESFGRFAAIFGITALGVGFLAGLLATTPDMKLSMDRYFDREGMMDIFVKSTGGITLEDAAAVEGLPEIERVQRARVTDALVKTSREEVLVSRIYGLPPGDLPGRGEQGGGGHINRPELVQGRPPERDDECLVQAAGGYFVPVPLGTVLTILPESAGGSGEMYAVREFTVTGIVKSPLFVSFEREPSNTGNGRLAQVIYVREGAYALPVWTDLYILLRGAAELDSFSPAYRDLVYRGTETIRARGAERAFLRREEIIAEGRKRIRETLAGAETAYRQAEAEARAELAAGQKRLRDGRAELAAGREELTAGERRLHEGRARLDAEAEQAEQQLKEPLVFL